MVESTMKRYPTAKDLGSWGYAKSLYLYGQYLVYKRTRDPRYLKYIKDWVDMHVDEQGVVTSANAQGEVREIKFDNLDSMLPGNLLLLLYQETKEPKYKLAAERIRKRFDTYPRTKDDGFWHATGKSREWQLWGDGVFMSMPFLVRYGSMFGDSKYANDEAVLQLLTYWIHLNDPRTGLMFHAYDESGQSTWADKETKHSAEMWCRAMGWFGMTLIEVLELLPRDHPQRPLLIGHSSLLVKAWARYQDKKTGLWYQVVDKGNNPENWLETSSSSMYTYVTAMAVDRGYVEKKYASGARMRICRRADEDLARQGWSNKHHRHLRRHKRRRPRLLLRAQAQHERLPRPRRVSDHEREVYEQNPQRQQPDALASQLTTDTRIQSGANPRLFVTEKLLT